MSGKFGRYDLTRLKKVAAALELIHMATLVHDDVIDDALTRRGTLTVKSKWDNRIAMYTGDYILGKALTKVTELEMPRIHQILSRAIVQMCIGEMEQIRHFFNPSQSVRTYLLRIRRKTALLIAVSCQLGAIAAEADEYTVQRLYSFGYNVGMAFQIRDDILDICGSEKELGKPPGSDIRAGQYHTSGSLCPAGAGNQGDAAVGNRKRPALGRTRQRGAATANDPQFRRSRQGGIPVEPIHRKSGSFPEPVPGCESEKPSQGDRPFCRQPFVLTMGERLFENQE